MPINLRVITHIWPRDLWARTWARPILTISMLLSNLFHLVGPHLVGPSGIVQMMMMIEMKKFFFDGQMVMKKWLEMMDVSRDGLMDEFSFLVK